MDRLKDKTTWLFDLDNTLYKASHSIFQQGHHNMATFISEKLQIDLATASQIREEYFHKYGLTLRGMMIEHDVCPDEFNHHVSQVDCSVVKENTHLKDLLSRLRGRKFIFSNGDRAWVDRILKRIGIEDMFEDIFSVEMTDYVPKPDAIPYDFVIDTFAITPEKAVFIDDLQVNLAPAAARGITTVWINPGHDQHKSLQAEDHHIHYEVEDLEEWLADVIRIQQS